MKGTALLIVLPVLGIAVPGTTAEAELIRYEIDGRINQYQPGVDEFVGASVGDWVSAVITIDSETPDLNLDPAIGEFAVHSIEVATDALSISVPAGSGQFIVKNDISASNGVLIDRFRMTCCDAATIPSITGTTFPPGAILETRIRVQLDDLRSFRFPSDAFPVDFDFRDEQFFFGVIVKDAETNDVFIRFAVPEPPTGHLLALGILALLLMGVAKSASQPSR